MLVGKLPRKKILQKISEESHFRFHCQDFLPWESNLRKRYYKNAQRKAIRNFLSISSGVGMLS
jgi:hypothetical protein